MKDLLTMSADEAAEVVAGAYQGAREKTALSWDDVKNVVSGAGKAVGNAWDSAKPHMQAAWENPYLRNSLLTAGGGAALAAGRNMRMSPEERRRRSLLGDALTGATLGGLAGLGGTMALENADSVNVAKPSPSLEKAREDLGNRIQSAQQGEMGVGDRFGVVGDILDGSIPRPDGALSALPGLMFPSPVPGMAGAGLGAAAGVKANDLIDKAMAPGTLRGMTPEELSKAFNKTKSPELLERITASRPGFMQQLKNMFNPAGAMGIDTREQLTQKLFPGAKNVDLNTPEQLLRGQLAGGRTMQAAAGPDFGVEFKPKFEATSKAIGDIGDQTRFINENSLNNQVAANVARSHRMKDYGRFGRMASRGALPLLGAMAGGAAGAQAPIGPSHRTIGDWLQSRIGGAIDATGQGIAEATSMQPSAAPQLPHWKPDDTAVTRDWYRGGAGNPF